MATNSAGLCDLKYKDVIKEKPLLLMRFIAELRKNNFPNSKSFSKILEKEDMPRDPRTILRWIDILKKKYHAPIAYDNKNKGFYLTDHEWDFESPDFDSNVLSSIMLSTQLASVILPPGLKEQVTAAMSQALCSGESTELDDAVIASFISNSKIIAAVDSGIFKTVFSAWSMHQVFKMSYQKPTGETKEYVIEPHIIAYNQGKWYIKGYEYGSKEKIAKCYAIQRIRAIDSKFIDTFEIDKDLIERTAQSEFFEFEKLENVKLYCEPSIVFYLKEQAKNMGYTLNIRKDGSATMLMPPMPKHEIIRYVLGEAGLLTVLEPLSLREEIAEIGAKIANDHKIKVKK